MIAYYGTNVARLDVYPSLESIGGTSVIQYKQPKDYKGPDFSGKSIRS